MKVKLITEKNPDLKICNAARVSFDKESELVDGELPEKDKKLLNYLANHNHWTPFSHARFAFDIPIDSFNFFKLTPFLSAGLVIEKMNYKRMIVKHSIYGWYKLLNSQVIKETYLEVDYFISQTLFKLVPNSCHALMFYTFQFNNKYNVRYVPEEELTGPWLQDITLREEVPIFVARQRFKHMVGFTYNEVSRRYVSDNPHFFTPDKWRSKPDKNKKQGSGDNTIDLMVSGYEQHSGDPIMDTPTNVYQDLAESSREVYSNMLTADVAPELARMVLPQSMYTSYYVTGSLAAWKNAYNLRRDTHAQKEIRDLAAMWKEIMGNKLD